MTVFVSASIKYADLLPYRSTDYLFDPIKFSDINGKTGTYLLYSTVRMASLLKKIEDNNIKYNNYNINGIEIFMKRMENREKLV